MAGWRVSEASADPVMVQRLLDRDDLGGIKPRTADYWPALRALVERRGFTDGQVAYHLRKSRRYAWRVRNKLGIPPVVDARAGVQRAGERADAPTLPRDRAR